MDASNHSEVSLHADLSQALARGEISLHYQPKVDSSRGKIRGVEALLRWHHPQRGPVGPDVFIPIAERYGLINTLGDWVINEACRQMQEWEQAGLTVSVAINLSVYQLRQENLGARIAEALHRHGVTRPGACCAKSPNRWPWKTSGPRKRPSMPSAAWGCCCRLTTLAPATPAWPTCASSRPSS